MGRGDPLSGFAPGVAFGITFWTPLLDATHWSPVTARTISALMALGGSMALFLAARGRRGIEEPMRLMRVAVTMVLIVFWFFYHINPEYYFMVAPVVLLVFPRTFAMIAALAVFTLSWAINFFFGVGFAISVGRSNVFVKLYRAIFGGLPTYALERATIASFGIGTLIVAVIACRYCLPRNSPNALSTLS
jgi:hypothetical protein